MSRHVQNKIKIIGMFKWNTNPSNKNKELLVSRRPNSKLNRKATDYLICPNCIGLYAVTNLRNHFTSRTGGAYKGARNVKTLSRAIEGRNERRCRNAINTLWSAVDRLRKTFHSYENTGKERVQRQCIIESWYHALSWTAVELSCTSWGIQEKPRKLMRNDSHHWNRSQRVRYQSILLLKKQF